MKKIVAINEKRIKGILLLNFHTSPENRVCCSKLVTTFANLDRFEKKKITFGERRRERMVRKARGASYKPWERRGCDARVVAVAVLQLDKENARPERGE